MATVERLIGREILDSRGNPTVEAELHLKNGIVAFGRSPSGASTGSHEAVELRDDDPKRFGGKGVQHAVANIEGEIGKLLIDKALPAQAELDRAMIELDGTDNKGRLGSNAILAVSLAAASAHALSEHLPLFRYIQELSGAKSLSLPIPLLNVVNGGKHADNPLDIQEFKIIPHGFDSYHEALRAGVETFQSLKTLFHNAGFPTNVGDEGGFSPKISSVHQVLDFLVTAIETADYQPGREISLGMDVAASELYQREHNNYRLEGKQLDGGKLLNFYTELVRHYPIVSIEDPFHEDDWISWQAITRELGDKIQLIGDDLFVTNLKRLEMGVENHSANAILIKVNQIGTLTETLETIKYGNEHDYRSVISHRSGETEDTFIAHLAVGSHATQMKSGAPDRSERTAKYNELLRIEEQLGSHAQFAKVF